MQTSLSHATKLVSLTALTVLAAYGPMSLAAGDGADPFRAREPGRSAPASDVAKYHAMLMSVAPGLAWSRNLGRAAVPIDMAAVRRAFLHAGTAASSDAPQGGP